MTMTATVNVAARTATPPPNYIPTPSMFFCDEAKWSSDSEKRLSRFTSYLP